MQGQLEEEAGRQGQFAEALSADPRFAEQHRRMIDAGYSVASARVDPSPDSAGDGSFEVSYESGERGDASIRGSMEDGTVSELEVSSEYEEARMLDALREDPRFAEMAAELEAGGYEQAGSEFASDGSTTEAVIDYAAAGEGADEEAAMQARIRAEFNGTDITSVSLEYGGEEEAVDPAHVVLAAAVAGGLAAAAYLAVLGQGAAPVLLPAPVPARRADPEAEARRLIAEARRMDAAGDEKGAFAHAARAVRTLLAGRLGMDREVTNAEMAVAIRLRGSSGAQGRGQEDGGGGGPLGDNEAATCLEAADLVEFARASPGDGDFGRIASLADGLLGDGDYGERARGAGPP